MDDKLRKIISAVLIAVLIPSLTMYIWQKRDKAISEEVYENAVDIATNRDRTPKPTATAAPTLPPDEEEEVEKVWVPAPIENPEEDPILAEMEEIDLSALREINPEVVGWIRIPDTKINYPIVQGEDNEFYLKNTWEKKRNYAGAIYMECRNQPDFTDFNTIVYGHNMKNDAMFGQLGNFKRQKYWEEHPYVYIRTDDDVFRYEIFSTYEANIGDPPYGLSFYQKKTRVAFLDYAKENNMIETGIEPKNADRILTLSTCSNDDEVRRVVQARLLMIKVPVTEVGK